MLQKFVYSDYLKKSNMNGYDEQKLIIISTGGGVVDY
jgi:hypothetical protein